MTDVIETVNGRSARTPGAEVRTPAFPGRKQACAPGAAHGRDGYGRYGALGAGRLAVASERTTEIRADTHWRRLAKWEAASIGW
jgi:hypothetical protein